MRRASAAAYLAQRRHSGVPERQAQIAQYGCAQRTRFRKSRGSTAPVCVPPVQAGPFAVIGLIVVGVGLGAAITSLVAGESFVLLDRQHSTCRATASRQDHA